MRHALLTSLVVSVLLGLAPGAWARQGSSVIILPVKAGSGGGQAPQARVELSPFGGKDRIARNISTPTLEVFSPPAGKASGAAMIVAPGGGFQFLSIDSEGEAVARRLAQAGVTAFVLRYRTAVSPDDPAAFKPYIVKFFRPGAQTPEELERAAAPAVEDGLAALRAVRARAADYGLDPLKIGITGFSAGGWVALSAATEASADEGPNLVAAIYPARSPRLTVGTGAPPLFLAVTADDPLLPIDGQMDLYSTWRKARRSAELHVYPRGGHGFGMNRQHAPSDNWVEAYLDWLGARGWLTREP